jgi:hypothetical protein
MPLNIKGLREFVSIQKNWYGTCKSPNCESIAFLYLTSFNLIERKQTMLKIEDLDRSKELNSDEMAKVVGGFWGWGGTIGNPRRKRRRPTVTRIYADGRRVRDYRKPPAPQWPIVQ